MEFMKLFKSSVLIILLSQFTHASCLNEVLIDDELLQLHNSKPYFKNMDNNLHKDKTSITSFSTCKYNGYQLYMYLFRTELPKITLIQFIWKNTNNSSQYDFKEFSRQFLNRGDIKEAISNVISDKKIIINMKLAPSFELNYTFSNGEFRLTNETDSSYNK